MRPVAKNQGVDTKCLSNAIEQALEDTERTEDHEHLTINMSRWVDSFDIESESLYGTVACTKHCSVCFAGGVMLHRYDNISTNTSPDDFTKEERDTFNALDCIRSYNFVGCILSFYSEKYYSETVKTLVDALVRLNLVKKSYDGHPTTFKSNMRKIIKELRKYAC